MSKLRSLLRVAPAAALLVSAGLASADSPVLQVEDVAAPAAEAADEAGLMKHEHRLVVSDEGSHLGRISLINPVTNQLFAAPKVTLQFVSTKGEVVHEAVVGKNGLFDLSDVPAGTYSVIARGSESLMAFGATIDKDGEFFNPPTDGPIALDGAAAGGDDTPMIESLVNVKESNSPADAYKPLKRPLRGVTTPIAHRPVEIALDGTVTGRVVRLDDEGRAMAPRPTEVTLVRNGRSVAATMSDAATGEWTFAEAVPGHYTVVAEGPDGFAIFALQMKKAANVINADDLLPVNYQDPYAAACPVSVALCCCEAEPVCFPEEEVIVEEFVEAPFAEEFMPPLDQGLLGPPPLGPGGGGFAGGGFGGGGGFAGGGGGVGGLGGLGGLLGLAGAGLGAAALIEANDDDDDDRDGGGVSSGDPDIVSPNTP